MSKPTMILNNPYVTCSRCGGCGLVQSWYVEDCSYCGGSGVVRDRDEKGRFRTHPFIYKLIGEETYEYVGPAGDDEATAALSPQPRIRPDSGTDAKHNPERETE